ncbi:hypothetical protein GCM10023083_14010 [Streptomyces phyllanthi]
MRGAFSVSPKSLTVNTITARNGGQPGGARPERAALRLLRGPEGEEIILHRGACHDKRLLATTRPFPLLAGAKGIFRPLRPTGSTPGLTGRRSRRTPREVCPRSL